MELEGEFIRKRKKTILAYGEGENEKIFLRHLVSSYCRSNLVTVATGSAGGGDPLYILHSAIRFRRGEIREIEFILLDTDKEWPSEMRERAKRENIKLIPNEPCLEALFLEILNASGRELVKGTQAHKNYFDTKYLSNNFNEEECRKIFTKAILKEARTRIKRLDWIIRAMEGESPGEDF